MTFYVYFHNKTNEQILDAYNRLDSRCGTDYEKRVQKLVTQKHMIFNCLDLP